MLAGMAFAHAGLGAVHGLAHPVGSLLHVPHGVSCAILMLPVFQFNMNACGRLYAELAHAFLPKEPRPDAALFIAAMRELSHGLGVPANLRDYGLAATVGDFSHAVATFEANGMRCWSHRRAMRLTSSKPLSCSGSHRKSTRSISL